MSKPKVTIIMATWNRSRLIGRAIASVRSQTFSDWELVICDDGSTDNTPEVIYEWQAKDPRIQYTRSDENQGISKNYNRGLRIAKGEYIAMIDDDDPWCDKDKLKKQLAFLEGNKEYAGCGGGLIVVEPGGRELYRYLKPKTDAEIRKYMLFSNPMANSTTLFPKRAGEKAGWYDESIRYAGDRDFWLKMGLVGKLYNIPEYFSYYTMSGENTSIARIRPHLRTSLMVMRRYKREYSGYPLALVLNWAQYGYSFLPAGFRGVVHTTLARLKRRTVG
jgi:glycosyltransferase involved in cell wall biosynthesis